jgi:hypothetical protein
MPGEKLKQLPENGFAGIHGALPKCGEGTINRNSNRKRKLVSKSNKTQILTGIDSNFTGQ